MKMNTLSTFALAAALAVAATASSAAMISTDTTPDLSLYGLNGSFSNVSVVSGNLSGVYASPFGAGTQSYYTVGSPGLTASAATLTLAAAATSFSLLWGSIDAYNAIEFLLGGMSVDTIDGGELGLGTAGNVTAGVDITGLAMFDTVKFYSNFGQSGDTAAFEFVTTAPAAIPVPAAGLMLLAALGGLGAMRRRKSA